SSHVQTGGEIGPGKEKGGAFDGDVAKLAREVAREVASRDLEEVNRRFNEELGRYISGKMKANEVFHLGLPTGPMKEFVPELPIVMRQSVVNKGSKKKHHVPLPSLINMPSLLSDPIFLFQRDKGSLSLLTGMKDAEGKNVFVAMDVREAFRTGAEVIEVNSITTYHGRDVENVILPIVENGTLVWVNKEQGLEYLSSASLKDQQEIDKQSLARAVKVVKEFEKGKGGVPKAGGGMEVLFRKTRKLPKFVAENADGDIAELSRAVVHNAAAGREAGKLIRGEFAKLGSGYRQLYAKFVDANAGLEKLYQTLGEMGIQPKEGENAYTHLQTSNGRALYLASEYKHKASEPLTKLLQDIVKGTDADVLRGYELTFYDDDGEVTTRTEADAYRVLGLYLSAKDIVESEELGLVGRGRSGFEESVSRRGAGVKPEEMVRTIEEAIGKAQTEELWDKIRGISRWVFDLQLSHGYISREVYDKYVNGERKYYVPQRGWASRSEEEEPTLLGMRKRGVSGGVRNTALKEAKGRESLADNPLQAFESIVQTTIDEVLKNDSKREFYRFYLSNERKLRAMGLFGVKRVYTVKKVRNGETVRNEAGETEYEATYDAPSAEMLAEDKMRREKIRELKKRVTALQKEDLAAERAVAGGVLTTEEAQGEREAIRRDLERVQESIAQEEREMNVKEGGSEAPRLRDMTPTEKQKQTVSLLEGGKKYELVFEKPYAEVAAALNRDYGEGSRGEWGAYLSRVTKWMSGMMTRYNPAFGVANGFRDFFAAVIYNGARFGGRYSARYLRNLGRTSSAVLRYSLYDVFGVTDEKKLYGEGEIGEMMHSYIKNGGPTGWSFMREAKEIRKDLKEAINPTRLEALKKGGKEAAESVLGLLSFISEASELEMRFAEYVTSREEVDEAGRAKYTEEEAIQHSKEVTTNFDRKGILRRWASYFYAFWNASIQGVNGIFKVAEDHGGKAKAAIWTTFVLLLNGGFVSTLMGLGDDDDERDEWTEWDRMNNLCLPGGWKVPLPQTYRSMWGFGVQMALFVKGRKEAEHALLDGFKYATGQFLPSNVSAVIDAADYNPVRGQVEYDFPRALTGALVPTMLVPEAELGTNTDFMGNSIYNTPFMLKQDGLVARSSQGKRNAYAFEGITDALFEAGGGVKGSRSALRRDDSGGYVPYLLDINPNVLKHLFTGHFGGLGTTVVGIADNVRRVTNGKPFDLNMIPYFSSITQKGKDYGDREVALWELKSYLEQYGEDWRVMKKEDPERYREVSLMPENPYGRNTPQYAEYMAEHGTNLQKRYDAWRRGEELVRRAEAGELGDAEVKEASRDLQREFRETR
ncbi:MAG: hypothetical protein PUJ95_01495, partial [Bacteroidales bacterium]|nr:hypothetical protein [Bacteroidales bacterium]